jgi:hypothetical protein
VRPAGETTGSFLRHVEAFVLRDENSIRYVKALYPVGFLLTLVPLVDLALRVYPPKFGTVQWRFAALGLLAGNLGTVLLGLGLIGLVAALVGHRMVLRVLAIIALVGGVLLVGGLGMFVLDALQVRRSANPQFVQALTVSTLGALFTGGLGLIALFSIGLGAWTASRGGPVRRSTTARGTAKAPATPLVVTAPNSGESL